jgi:uncharacterized protein with ParB-like and HNH nuclease domain
MERSKKALPATVEEVDEEEFEAVSLRQEGIEDDALSERSTSATFSISSYGADYTVDSLVKRMRAESFFVPPFQRSFVWSQRHASKFIESLLLGLPVPGIFVYKEDATNKHLIIDGQQRLKTLLFFYEGVFGERAFSLIDVREPWAGCTYKTLPDSDKLRLDDSILHTTIFKQDSPTGSDQSVYEVFERINSTGIKLTDQEVRVCVNFGQFYELLKEVNKVDTWRKVFGPKHKRLKDQELILRFLAFRFERASYVPPMKKFLNDFMGKHRNLSSQQAKTFSDTFKSAIEACNTGLGDRPFRPERLLNTAVFDSVMVGVSERLAKGAIKDWKNFKSVYEKLLVDTDYKQGYIRSTADFENVNRRMSGAIKAFSAVK